MTKMIPSDLGFRCQNSEIFYRWGSRGIRYPIFENVYLYMIFLSDLIDFFNLRFLWFCDLFVHKITFFWQKLDTYYILPNPSTPLLIGEKRTQGQSERPRGWTYCLQTATTWYPAHRCVRKTLKSGASEHRAHSEYRAAKKGFLFVR